MRDSRLRALYRRGIAGRGPAARGDRSACVTPERLEALAERRLPEAERIAALNHVMACEACRAEWELLRAVDHALRPRRRLALPLALAASLALALGVGVVWRAMEGGGEAAVMRGSASEVVPLSPAGALADAPAAFVWRPVDSAVEYALVVVDAEGAPVLRAATVDTQVALPATLALRPGGEYRWWVAARLPTGAEVRSTATAFRVAP